VRISTSTDGRIDDRAQVARLVVGGLTQLLYRRKDCAALGVTEHDDERRAIPRSCELDAADL
jgi:hypothetical protein